MEKQRADKLILEYRDKIFGFAIGKTQNIATAEELASDIVCEVYASFRNSEEILNPDGYVYRIASNVYANYLKQLKGSPQNADVSEMLLPFCDEGFSQIEMGGEMEELRREIGYLSEKQRRIIYLHYYENKSVHEIAKCLGISTGTVKWHLSDARSTLKEELTMEKYKDDLTVNPIEFTNMGHNGKPGNNGDTADMFNTRLKQNIAWSCYYTPLTVTEISQNLSVPRAYVADEIKVLEEYGYLDRLDNSKNPKYRTNMFITDERLFDNSEEIMYKEAAIRYCNEYFAKVFEDFDKSDDNWGLFCAGNDKNFMKYTLVMLCLRYTEGNNVDFSKYNVKRPDGGDFIAHANISNTNTTKSFVDFPYWCCGYMCRNTNDHENIQCDCRFSDRSELAWRDNLQSDWEGLYQFIKNSCDKNSLEPESYKRLCDKGYVYHDKVQIILTHTPLQQIIREHTCLPESLKRYNSEFDRKCYENDKDKYPEHIRPIVRLYCTDKLHSSLFLPFLIEAMLEKGMLLPLTEIQKKSVFSVLQFMA